jgi:hypothetical protein
MTDHVTELSGFFGRYLVDTSDRDVYIDTQARFVIPHYSRFTRIVKLARGNQNYFGVAKAVLYDLEALNSGNVPNRIDQSQAVHDGAVCSDNEIRASALNFL